MYKYYHVLIKPVCLYISRHIRGSSVTASEYTNSTTLITSLTMSVSGKKLINSPSAVVDEALEGLTMINPGLRLLEGHRVVVRKKVSGNNKHTNKTIFGINHEYISIITIIRKFKKLFALMVQSRDQS